MAYLWHKKDFLYKDYTDTITLQGEEYIEQLAGIKKTDKVCKDCLYYGKTVLKKCPSFILQCVNYDICGEQVKRSKLVDQDCVELFALDFCLSIFLLFVKSNSRIKTKKNCSVKVDRCQMREGTDRRVILSWLSW